MVFAINGMLLDTDKLTKSVLLTVQTMLVICTFLVSSTVSANTSDIAELKSRMELLLDDDKNHEVVILALELQSLAHARNDRAVEFFALRNQGYALGKLSMAEDALRAFLSAVELIDPSVKTSQRLVLYINMSSLLLNMNRDEEVLAVVEQGLALAREIGDEDSITLLESNKAGALTDLGKSSEAEELFQRILPRLKSSENRHNFIAARNNLAMLHKHREDYDQALSIFHELLLLSRQDQDDEMIVYVLLELGDIGRIRGEYDQARGFLDEALEISERWNIALWLQYSHSYLAELDKATGDMDSADEHTRQVKQLGQQLAGESVVNQAEILKVKLAVLEHKNQIELLEKNQQIQAMELDRSRTLAVFAGLVALFLALFLVVLDRQNRQKTQVNYKLANANYKLDQLASTDFLTGLANRRSMLDQVEHNDEKRHAHTEKTTLIMVDIDHFKQVNDQHGHDHGDAVLVQVSQRLKNELRATDLVARWGGEEFLVMLPETGSEQGLRVAETLRQSIATSAIAFEGIDHPISITLGVATYSNDGTFEQTLQRADAALYKGKQQGRNRVVAVE